MLRITIDSDQSAWELRKLAMTGELIQMSNVRSAKGYWITPAFLQKQGDFFVMWGITGTHKLAVKATDESRLKAHWRGFKAQALARAAKEAA